MRSRDEQTSSLPTISEDRSTATHNPPTLSQSNDLPSELLILSRFGITLAQLETVCQLSLTKNVDAQEILIRLGLISQFEWEEAQRLLDSQRNRAYLRRKNQDFLLDQAINKLRKDAAHYSAASTLNRWQGFALILSLGALITLNYFQIPYLTLGIVLFLTAFYPSHILLRSLILAEVKVQSASKRLPVVADEEALPVYSVCVALYKEAEQIPDLVWHLMQLQWPKHKLDIKLICEDNDSKTIDAVLDCSLPDYFDLIIVPDALPKTKPKALNYALPLCRGEFLVLYDAEDRPSAGQLLEAFNKFSSEDLTLACVQAPLHIHNFNQSWLTRLFHIEYLTLFNGILPVLAKWRTPMPLGGTSNHFRADILKKVGAWDPFNVTEDADLGIRLFREGYRCDTISLPTYEEAPPQFDAWLKQRTRWIKGWMQTILVHSRQPFRLIREIGVRNALTFHILLTALVISALAHPILLFLLFFKIFFGVVSEQITSDTVIFLVSVFNLVAGYLTYGLLAFIILKSLGKNEMKPSLFGIPIYWLLISIAAWRALVQLYFKPHYWEKTQHSLYNHKFRQNF